MSSYLSLLRLNLIKVNPTLLGLTLFFSLFTSPIATLCSDKIGSTSLFKTTLAPTLTWSLILPALAEGSPVKESPPSASSVEDPDRTILDTPEGFRRESDGAQNGIPEEVSSPDTPKKSKSSRRREEKLSSENRNLSRPPKMVQVPYGVEYRPFGSDPRGPANLTICSQNLMNYEAGAKTSVKLESLPHGLQRKIEALLRRFEAAQCDVIAVQEVLGKQEEHARNSLRHLATILSIRTGRNFEFIVAPGDYEPSRVGYLVAKDSAEVLNSMSFSKVELPKLSPNESSRYFVRTPLELQLRTKDKEGRGAKVVTLINLHSKAKRGAHKDPTELKWETYRMEIAEAIRRIVLNRHRGSLFSGKSIIAILGDRNANYDSASAKILDGSLMLKHFTSGGQCRVSKSGMPICAPGIDYQPSFHSVLTTDPETKLLPGTHVFKGEASWLDDILLSVPSLRFAWASAERAGDYESGVISAFPAASDHALVWTKLNW